MRLATGVAFIAGVAVASTLAAMDRSACMLQLTGLDTQRIAREGKTDLEFYAFDRRHFPPQAVSIHIKDRPAP